MRTYELEHLITNLQRSGGSKSDVFDIATI